MKVFKSFLPIYLLFFFTEGGLLLSRNYLLQNQVPADHLLIGNLILIIVARLAFQFYQKAMTDQHPQAFVRHVYSGMLVKFFICLTAAFIYILTVDKVDKTVLFGLMGLYFLYTFVEIKLVLTQHKQQ